jgi:hypothetical protein
MGGSRDNNYEVNVRLILHFYIPGVSCFFDLEKQRQKEFKINGGKGRTKIFYFN